MLALSGVLAAKVSAALGALEATGDVAADGSASCLAWLRHVAARSSRQAASMLGTARRLRSTACTQADLAADAGSADPLVGLRAVEALRRLLERLEAIQVDNARRQGWSWQEIALVLGVSKQAVHKKHARPRPRRER